jgi:ribosome-binding protein aMBF1 (putative translation factor)
MSFDASGARILLGMAEPKLYDWSVTIATACNKQSRTFLNLAEKLKMDVVDLMRQCNGKVAPSKALVKGLARELELILLPRVVD